MWRMTIFTVFFRCLSCKCWICRLCSKTKIPDWTVSMETVRTAKSWPRKNQWEHRDWVCHIIKDLNSYYRGHLSNLSFLWTSTKKGETWDSQSVGKTKMALHYRCFANHRATKMLSRDQNFWTADHKQWSVKWAEKKNACPPTSETDSNNPCKPIASWHFIFTGLANQHRFSHVSTYFKIFSTVIKWWLPPQ